MNACLGTSGFGPRKIALCGGVEPWSDLRWHFSLLRTAKSREGLLTWMLLSDCCPLSSLSSARTPCSCQCRCPSVINLDWFWMFRCSLKWNKDSCYWYLSGVNKMWVLHCCCIAAAPEGGLTKARWIPYSKNKQKMWVTQMQTSPLM